MSTYGFTNPVLAVEHFRNNAANYDIVVTDIRMPQMNGFEVARAVKEIKPDIKLAFITAFEINKSEFEKVLPSIKADAFIKKPVKSSTFAEVIKEGYGARVPILIIFVNSGKVDLDIPYSFL